MRKLGIFTCENNMLSSRVKMSLLLWLHNKSHLSHQKTIKVKWFGSSLVFIKVCCCMSVEKIFHLFTHFLTLKENFRISMWPCNVLYICNNTKDNFLSEPEEINVKFHKINLTNEIFRILPVFS